MLLVHAKQVLVALFGARAAEWPGANGQRLVIVAPNYCGQGRVYKCWYRLHPWRLEATCLYL